jgi:hypothetical protein
MSPSELSRKILWRGIDDWIRMDEVAWVGRELLPNASQDEVREQCIQAIGELRDAGLARVGDLAPEGFTAWTGATGDILLRIDTEWRALGTPRMGDIAWLENTPIGNRLGIAEWKKWQEQQDRPRTSSSPDRASASSLDVVVPKWTPRPRGFPT